MNRTNVVDALNKIKAGQVSEGVAAIERLLEVPEDWDRIVGAAIAMYCDLEIEIDDEPSASEAEDGCWVSAWVWVPRSEPEEEEEEEEEE